MGDLGENVTNLIMKHEQQTIMTKRY